MKLSDLAFLNSPEGRLRVISAVVLAPVFLAVVYLGGAAYAGMIILITAVGLYEWLRLVDPDAPKMDRYGIFAAHVIAVFLAAAGLPQFGLVIVLMAAVAFYAHRSNMTDAKPAFWFALGLPYMTVSAIAMIWLRSLPEVGSAMTEFLLACVWGMDIGAYMVGRIVGGAKLAPAISPNKTWSGLFGGLGLAAILCAVILLANHSQSFWAGMIAAILTAAVAQAGDLFKSFFKRRAGVKNSGNLIPGHGGVLDRIDGLVFGGLFLAFQTDILGSHFIW